MCIVIITIIIVKFIDCCFNSVVRHRVCLCSEYLLIFFLCKGQNFATMIIHMLCHLPDCFRNWGPLWAYSCFPYEGRNGSLKRFFHGSRQMNNQVSMSLCCLGKTSFTCIVLQIAFTYTMSQVLPTIHYTRQTKVQYLLDVLILKSQGICINHPYCE